MLNAVCSACWKFVPEWSKAEIPSDTHTYVCWWTPDVCVCVCARRETPLGGRTISLVVVTVSGDDGAQVWTRHMWWNDVSLNRLHQWLVGRLIDGWMVFVYFKYSWNVPELKDSESWICFRQDKNTQNSNFPLRVSVTLTCGLSAELWLAAVRGARPNSLTPV